MEDRERAVCEVGNLEDCVLVMTVSRKRDHQLSFAADTTRKRRTES